MDVVLVIFCVACIATSIALVLMMVRLKRELRLMARLLEGRSAESNARITLHSRSREVRALAKAINSELDTSQAQHISALRSRAELHESLVYLSHDIRTPLTGAQGYAQLLEEDDPAARQRHIAAIRRRLIDVRHLLDQLFIFTQTRSADFSVELLVLDANALLSDVLLACYPQFLEAQLEPVIELDDESSLVLAGQDELRRVFQNLVANALLYAQDSFTVRQKGCTYYFSNDVEDIGSLDTDRLFERFYQGKVSQSAQGSGLGLAIVEQLATKMGAKVSAEIEGKVLTVVLSMKVPYGP